jgi:DNA-binding transcriptional LysR family regulator
VAACPPPLVVETSSLAMMMAMLVESDCITLLPRSQIRDGSTGGAMVVPELETPAPGRMVGYTMRSDWLRTRCTDVRRAPARRVRDASACERSRHALP